jgi:hypothetical protein
MMTSRTSVTDRRFHEAVYVLTALAALAVCSLAEAQNFFQVSNPRTYRIDPPLTPALPSDLVPQMLGYRPTGANGTGSVILNWQTSQGEDAQTLEVSVNFNTTPPADSTNDATLITQISAFNVGTAIDWQSDQRVLVMSRTVGTRQALIALGPFVFDQQGNITNLRVDASISPPVVTGGLGTNLGPQGLSFGGIHDVDGVLDWAAVIFAGDPAGLWAADLVTLQWLDANASNTGGANAISPLIPWSGNTGGVNLDPGGHRLRGVDVIGNIAFLLTARQSDPADTGSIQYYLIQVDLLVQQRLAVVNLGDLFDSRMTSPTAISMLPRPPTTRSGSSSTRRAAASTSVRSTASWYPTGVRRSPQATKEVGMAVTEARPRRPRVRPSSGSGPESVS